VYAAKPDAEELLAHLLVRRDPTSLTHVERVPARAAQTQPWPEWTPPALRSAWADRGIEVPWRHQVQAATAAYAGEHVVLATGTASGKSLAYQLPVLARLLSDSRATALYICPTKALAADQLRSVVELDLPDIHPSGYDGDTPQEEREWVRAHARLVLTNPDMLHRSILPRHSQWSSFLRRLQFVVVDECHTYRGVFGSHVAQVLRRLRRVLRSYASTARATTAHAATARATAAPVFILASATAGDPGTSAARLTGLPVHPISDDASPRGGMVFGLWEPPLLPGVSEVLDAAPIRRSASMETADLLADAVSHGVRTLAFVRSRRGVEVVASAARRALAEAAPDLAGRVAAYRGGYLREERRDLERRLLDGSLIGLAATNALELGIDVAGLDAVLLAGYPGTLASLWQQAGRAGRRGSPALCVLVARDDPLDTYLVHHPESLFGRGIEATVLDPLNPYVLGPHLCCAAAEIPLREDDLELFGGEIAASVLQQLVKAGSLRRRPTGWYWAAAGRPDVDLRGSGRPPVTVVESATGRLLGTVDAGSSHVQVHTGAVYLHQGVSYVVEDLDLEDGAALVRQENPNWTTHPRDITGMRVLGIRSYIDAGPVGLFLGDVEVTNQVVAYQRRQLGTREIIDTRPLDLPPRQLRTVAVWWTVSLPALDAAGIATFAVPGALHAAEHASIGLLPLVATCDRWDIGGLSTAVHEDTGVPTVFVYDGHEGGAGFAERAYHSAQAWLAATRAAISECQCEVGCPSCVHSPKCGNGNDPLDKAGAVAALDVVLGALGSNRSRAATRAQPGRARIDTQPRRPDSAVPVAVALPPDPTREGHRHGG
jgi:DEAD/DEAH box helicase domain-containing protein